MKNPIYLIILLALGLVVVAYGWISSRREAEAARESVATATTTYSDIMTRCSVRAYSDRKVSEEQVDSLLRAAMAAPSAANKQPWRFVVVNDRKTLDFIASNFKSMTMMSNAALAIVVCGDMKSTLEGEGGDYWVQDTSAATENLLLAAHAMGLGAVWCGVYPMTDRVKIFSELLHLPADIVPLNCIAIGWPEGDPEPKDKWDRAHVHYNTWDGAPATFDAAAE
ncbi:MAG: nitroreductase family protein [Muribaculaceae bacterium]|nr:nitroreductase family protein [Muribaculaceae bacterium]